MDDIAFSLMPSDSAATPGDVAQALAGLLLDLVEREPEKAVTDS
jgi:hypothetical protein